MPPGAPTDGEIGLEAGLYPGPMYILFSPSSSLFINTLYDYIMPGNAQ